MDAPANPSLLSDAIVVGGGLIGCSIALRLAQAGLLVRVFDRGHPGCEASSAGAGMIAPQGETAKPDSFYDLCAASRDLYPAFAEEVENLSEMSVDFHADGTILAAFDDSQAADLNRIYKAQTEAGLHAVRLGAEEARRRVPNISPRVLDAVYMAGDFRVDNELLVEALVAAGRRAGVTFCSHASVTRFIGLHDRVEFVEVRDGAGSGTVRYQAGVYVLAAGAWSVDVAGSLYYAIPAAPCRGQLMEFEGAGGFPLTVRAGHYYLVPRRHGRLVAGSNMEYVGFEKAVTGEGLRSILNAAWRIAPFVAGLQFRRAWSGLRPDTPDHLPILGYGKHQNLVFATGHFRNGILLTPITAKLISELILNGLPSPLLDPYSPARFQISPHK